MAGTAGSTLVAYIVPAEACVIVLACLRFSTVASLF